ncbi:farnesyldiphosphate:farnesyldiphosphatefarnesyltransferase (squalene synthase) Erg9 [Schizosaccharomyces osmophilus]|uniref:Squalene synthase n=1 Tax=Schizosaccharomyces osmophilus TaxID=2545709 RepID=A0AAF0AUF0_9SCHI|nr:farnesyldiphosphate:farnesyldiphosphatefarnesyltransferase (squalene synthase) Erg9 [Schizosaccharomyces osmophilus]WBW72421.1 farnesyldiphosphate:farnesyldiphosphatefarnesyltransferase (squalene synthase) Erg9 [Schizosaccharomyces osmophilus]
MLSELSNRVEEFRCICQYKLWHDVPTFAEDEELPHDIRQCYIFLDKTSRSFSAVIKTLPDQLREAIMLFYLILRALDTVEDDMTLPLDKKIPILRSFHEKIEQKGWNFQESGPNEKDREVLVKFDIVISEFLKLDEGYRNVIRKSTREMGEGMAHYVTLSGKNDGFSVSTVHDYDQYCHYVAGLVGIGLSRLFAESQLEDPEFAHAVTISNSLGLFLQKTNIIRDYREDFDDNRHFWPKEIWSKYVTNFGEFCQPENSEKALTCLSEMTANALTHATDALTYIASLQDQKIFNFVAIPQVMAIATLSVVFRNPTVFQTNVKIRKGQAVQIVLHSVNIKNVCDLFLRYTRQIHYKNTPKDPNFLKISIQCGNIEQACETIFPRRYRELYDKVFSEKLFQEKKGNVKDESAKVAISEEVRQQHKKDMTDLGISVGIVLLIVFSCVGILFYVLGLSFSISDLKNLKLM